MFGPRACPKTSCIHIVKLQTSSFKLALPSAVPNSEFPTLYYKTWDHPLDPPCLSDKSLAPITMRMKKKGVAESIRYGVQPESE